MLCITRTVGNQCAVYDTDDGTIEWHNTDTIAQFESQGFQFQRGVLNLAQNQCNFGKNKENIFANYKIVHHTGDKYELVSKSAMRKFKFRLQNGVMCFNIGVNVSAQGVNL